MTADRLVTTLRSKKATQQLLSEIPLDEAVRHVESLEDIANIDAFTTSLADHAKL